MVIILKNQQKRYRRESLTSNDATSTNNQNSLHLLEKKISDLQEELTELYKRKGEVKIKTKNL